MKVEMTKAEASRWIVAINLLIKERYTRQLKEGKYDIYNGIYICCPFCPIVGFNCLRCLWYLFDNRECRSLGKFNEPEKAPSHIARLKKWRSRLYKIRERATR